MAAGSGLTTEEVDDVLAGHLIDPAAVREVDFDRFFRLRREALCVLVEKALKKSVQRDISEGAAHEDSSFFEESELQGDPEPDEE